LCGTVDGHLTDCKLFKRPNNEKKPSSPQPHTRSTSSSSSSPSSIFIPPPPPQLSETQYVKNGQCALCGTVDGHLTHCRLFKRSNNEYKPTTNQPPPPPPQPQSSSFKFTASTSSYSSSSSHRYNNYNRRVHSALTLVAVIQSRVLILDATGSFLQRISINMQPPLMFMINHKHMPVLSVLLMV
jgi:hypothetical protein